MARKKAVKDDPNTERERLGVDLPKKLKNDFDVLPTQLGLTMTEVVEELVTDWVKQHRTKVSL